MKKCKYCEYETDKPNTFKKHLKYHHYDNKNCDELEYDFIKIFYGLNNSDINTIIHLYNHECYSVMDIAEIYNKTRSIISLILKRNEVTIRNQHDAKKTQKYINKIEKTCLNKYGVKNPSSSIIIKNKRKNTCINKFGYEASFCDAHIRKKALGNINYDELTEKIKKSIYKKYGVYNITQLKWVSDKISKSRKKRMNEMSYEEKLKLTENARKNIKYESKIQLRIQKLINKLNIEYRANGFLWRYNYDFIFKNKKILEIQGDFWHANPKKYKKNDMIVGELTAENIWKKDERKKIKALNNGYNIYYLWENEINNMSDENIINYLINNIVG